MRSQQGQALIVIALCVAVLVAGLAFAVDWGYAIAQRRVMQTIADAAALGAGKFLASAVITVNGSPAFTVTQEKTWCAAKKYDSGDAGAPGNHSFPTPNSSAVLDVFYWNGTTRDPVTYDPIWTTSAKPANENCAQITTNTDVPRDTIFVRVATAITFGSLFASIATHANSTAGASARVRLSGTPVPIGGGPMWAMVRHYKASDFNNTCTVTPCDPTDPTQVQPKTFWDPNAPDVAYGSFHGLIDFSRNSPSFGTAGIVTPQLVTQPDSWAHAPNALVADQSASCGNTFGAGLWDSWGQADTQQDKQCSIPNWVYYGFRGTLSLDSQWASLPPGSQQESPSTLTTRSICTPPPNPAPSCAHPTWGDWVETAGGQVADMSPVLRRALADRGSSSMPYSDRFVPGTTTRFGKGLVILVFLWDCGEEFNKNAAVGSQWSLIVPGGQNPDCSQLNKAPGRVHLFTVAPFTVYEGTVGFNGGNNTVSGYWGGLFGDPDSCQSCALNGLANTAVMVPDN